MLQARGSPCDTNEAHNSWFTFCYELASSKDQDLPKQQRNATQWMVMPIIYEVLYSHYHLMRHVSRRFRSRQLPLLRRGRQVIQKHQHGARYFCMSAGNPHLHVPLATFSAASPGGPLAAHGGVESLSSLQYHCCRTCRNTVTVDRLKCRYMNGGYSESRHLVKDLRLKRPTLFTLPHQRVASRLRVCHCPSTASL